MSNDIAVQRFKAKEQSLPSHRATVAVAATLSLTATSFLLIYVVVLFILSSLKINNVNESSGYHPPCSTIGNKSNPTPPVRQHLRTNPSRRKIWLQSWARHRLSFIKTPFGIMFINLVLADFIQALGFGMNYFWVANVDCRSPSCQTTCTIQGVLIQIGDVASAFSNLMIAIQTFVILTFSWYLPNWMAWASLGLIWIPVFVLGLAAPTIMGNWSGPNPFYTWAGDWCWISEQFSPLRLFLHYLWIFISAFASIALYGHLFLRLQIHFRHSKAHHGLKFMGGKGKNGPVHTDMTDGPVIPLHGDHLRKKLERKARAMLMYPIAFIFMILPLSAYRLASLAGHEWGITAATVCGTLYCLSGFIDVLLFGTTRSILSVPVFSLNIGNGTEVIGTNGIGAMSTSGLSGGGTRSVAFKVEVLQETRVEVDLDEPTESEREKTKSRGQESSGGGSGGGSSSLAHSSTSQLRYQRQKNVSLVSSRNPTNPLLQPIRLSNATIINTDSDLESRHPSLTVFSPDMNLSTHPSPTDPTPWYEPVNSSR
ncbi:hypothetical protein PSTG_15013 [Puccinia striiformis f. sp. tritici PST-78]|uniref:Uncharacterized protein n=1 Tax=Puccinia striiformis f. sp. tritici PST-78 TaxID=1165861 RepID=A0A0L0UXA9_9BASI|nr:hypothetical protein PSTG_15013 [Puccinia striiformis f. sp. tritici PST-78]